jgi:hypothetical protein
MFVKNDKIKIIYLILFGHDNFLPDSVNLGAKLIADFRLRIAGLNTKHVTHLKSEIRNLQSEILST